MTIRLWHIIVFVVALAVFALMRAPASLVAGRVPDFSFARAEGTVWNGRFEGVSFGALETDTLTWKLSFWDLIQGGIIADASAQGGAVTGDMRFLANFMGDKRILAPSLTLQGLPLGPSLRLAGETQAQDLDIYFDDGVCTTARGQLRSDALQRNAELLNWSGPMLAGDARCDGDDALVALGGAEGAETVRVLLRLHGNGEGEWRVAMEGATPASSAALSAAGFAPDSQGALSQAGDFRWTPF